MAEVTVVPIFELESIFYVGIDVEGGVFASKGFMVEAWDARSLRSRPTAMPSVTWRELDSGRVQPVREQGDDEVFRQRFQ